MNAAVGYVYFLRAGNGPIKIGFTTRPNSRLSQIKTASAEPITVVGLIFGSPADETAFHREFASSRKAGEWFEPSQALSARIAEAVGTFGAPWPEKDAPQAADDNFSMRATIWVAALEKSIAQRKGITEAQARKIVATGTGLLPGTLEGIRRGRLGAISAAAFDTLREFYIATLEDELSELQQQLAQVENPQAQVAKAKAILNGAAQ